MSRVKLIVLSACLVTAAFASQFTSAASPSQRDCEAAGGTFTKERGEVVCVIATEENVGKSDNSQTVETTTETTGRGNIDNKQTQTTECDGPGNSGESSSHCK